MKKRGFAAMLITIALAAMLVVGCQGVQSQTEVPFVNAESATINIFSFNDFHGTVDKSASSSNPGADRFTAIVQHLMADNENSIILAAGDNYQGSPLSNVFYGEPVSDMIKYLGVPFSALGNHEFDWGTEYIEKYAADGGVTFLAANIFIEGTNNRPAFVQPYGIVQIGGVRIGIIGLTTVDTPSLVKAENVEGLEFRAPGPWLADMIDFLKNDLYCGLVIGLTHMAGGPAPNTNTSAAPDPASELGRLASGYGAKFDALIGGHQHTLIAGTVNNVPIIVANYNGRGLGWLEINYQRDGTTVITPKNFGQNDMNQSAIIDSQIVNPFMHTVIANYNEKIGPMFNTVVGRYGSAVTSRDEQAEWATKVVHDYIVRQTGHDYILIQNAGGWRDTSPYNRTANTDVTLGYLYTLMPFDNEIVLLEMRGRDLLYMLGTPDPALISAAVVAGAFNDRGTWRLGSASAPGAAISADAVYKVACNDFMLTGGDNYPFPGSPQGNAAGVQVLVTPAFMGVPLRDAMIDELQHRQGR